MRKAMLSRFFVIPGQPAGLNPESIAPHECEEKWIPDSRCATSGMTTGGACLPDTDQAISLAGDGDDGKRLMAFEPKIKGVNSSGLFEYEDELGKCYIGGTGGMPEREHAFYYADDKYEFCFYADRNWDGDEFDVDVKNATIYRFHGPRPDIDPADFDRISRNMVKFFATRWFLVPGKPIPPTEKFRSLKLSWRLDAAGRWWNR